MLSLLYVSRSCLSGADFNAQLQEILDKAVHRNLANGITGALVHTGGDFAQILEGPEGKVSQIMASILIDPRHERVSIVRRDAIERRSFPNWGMALVGHIPRTRAQIEAIRTAGDDATLNSAVDGLVQWMKEGASAQV
jgi:hypothetical protein